MQSVIVSEFGGPEQLAVLQAADPQPGPGLLRFRVTSIGLNRADLMGRAGQYKLSTGDPPYTPGLEAGGVVDAVGEGVESSWVGRRVTLRPEATRLARGDARVAGTYRSHVVCQSGDLVVIQAPAEVLPETHLGTLWLSHFTAWGGLIWKLGQGGDALGGKHVAISAASSAVALAAAQVTRRHGGVAIGLTSSPAKADALGDAYDHLVLTHDADGEQLPFRRELKRCTDARGVDVVFDPVAAGPYLTELILSLNQHGTVLVYGLLGRPGVVDVTPLIRKHASIIGYVNDEVFESGTDDVDAGIAHVVEGFSSGAYAQRVDRTFALSDVQEAHREMAAGRHVGKLVLAP
ncbi:MAG: zinc-binding dehydrogenase [Planctomycetota bacterium]